MSVHLKYPIRRSAWLALVLSLALQACGGGGGGSAGGDTVATPSNPQVLAPLALSSANLRETATASLFATEAPLKLAQHAVSEVMTLAGPSTLQLTVSCSNGGGAGGSRRYVLQDADNNQKISAGDTIAVEYASCNLEYLGGTFSGTLTIRLASVDDAGHGAVSGSLDLGSGLRSRTDPDGRNFTWLGSLQFRRTSSLLNEQLSVSASSADDLRRSLVVPSASSSSTRVEAYQQPAITRTLDRPTARIQVSGSLRLASELLGGRVDIGFDPDFSAYLSNHADRGGVRVAGAANASILVPASPDVTSASTEVGLDTNADGRAETRVSMAWQDLLSGYLWSEGSYASDGNVGPATPTFLRLLRLPTHDGAAGRGVDPNWPLLVQFGRPLNSNTVVNFRLLDNGATMASSYGVDDALTVGARVIEVRTRIQGAAIVLEPLEALRSGHSYQLQASSTADYTAALPVLLRDSSGNAQYSMLNQFTSFETDGALWAAVSGAGRRSVLMPGYPATLNASVPFATGLPLRYRWTQLNGPSLVIGSPEAATTSIALAPGAAPGIGRATLQITVTDAIGRASVDQIEMQVANAQGATTLLYFASERGDFIGQGETRLYLPQTGAFTASAVLGYLVVSYDDAVGSFQDWSLWLKRAGGGVPTIGNYSNVQQFSGSTAGLPEMNFSGGGRSCILLPSSFNLLEIEQDAAGNIQRLAVDFVQKCVSNTQGSLRGAIRINSGIPVRY